MATVGTLEIPPELEAAWKEFLRVVSPKKYGSVAKKGHLLSKKAVRAVAARSLLPEIRDAWAGLTQAQRDAWGAAAQQNAQTGWRLFVQDTSYRLKYGLPGLSEPSLFHQYKVAHVDINAPASGVLLKQTHPPSYYKRRKVPGTKSSYEEVRVDEHFQLPLLFGMSYRTALTALNENARIEIYAVVKSSYQGRTIESETRIALPLSSDWARETALVTEVVGVVRSYELFIESRDCRGWFEFDNVISYHSGSNYARDARCNDVNNELTRLNYQVEKSWKEVYLPTGAAYDSIYV